MGCRLLPVGSLPPANSKVPTAIHQDHRENKSALSKATAQNVVGVESTRKTAKARVMWTGQHSSEDDSDESSDFGDDDKIKWAHNYI